MTVKKKKRKKTVIAKQPPLSIAEEYYIKGNMEVVEAGKIANDLGRPPKLIRDFIAKCEAGNPQKSRANKLLDRPANGVVQMTEAASMEIDERRGRGITNQAEINAASAAGNRELAAKLAEQREKQLKGLYVQQQAKYSGSCHIIHPEKPQ